VVEKASIIEAADAIRDALRGFVQQGESDNIHVFESSPGCLRVILGSDLFKQKGLTERQKIIWEYLDEHVDRKLLAYCFGVHPLDVQTYKEQLFRQSSSRSMDLFMRGTTASDDDIS